MFTVWTASFNIQKFCVQYIYVFCVDLRMNNDFFSLYRINLSVFITEAESNLLRDNNWVFKSDKFLSLKG